MIAEQTQEIWQVEANNQVFETNFSEMTEWISDGSLLRMDRVRKGNLRWIEAGKVPSLIAVFNEKEAGQISLPVITLTKLGPTIRSSTDNSSPAAVDSSASFYFEAVTKDQAACSMHPGVPAFFVCETCSNQFCKACPNSYGGTVKICPFCGAMCSPLTQVEKVRTEIYYAPVDGFGFGDLVSSFAYPFRFKSSLIMGAIIFMFLSVGQSVVSFGGIFMMWGAIACSMLANTLTFGILANTVENFSQGKLDENFMPSFDEFSLWEDVVHPFFLMIGVYVVSFGPLVAVLLIGFFLIIAPVSKEITNVESDAARVITPGLSYAANAASKSEKVNELFKKASDQQQKRVEAMESGVVPTDGLTNTNRAVEADEFDDKRIQELDELIQESRKSQLESAIGKSPETVATERDALVKQFFSRGLVLVAVIALALLWAFFYFPAACAVAGYTRSVGATLNPAIGLNTIRVLGLNYVKILAMVMILAVLWTVIGGILGTAFAAFNLPQVGNLPANAIGSLFVFYFSIVFSCLIGFALFKSAEKLKLLR